MKNENGLVFVSVTVTIALFIVLGFGLVAIAGNDLFWVDRQRSSAQAFAIAEGGLAVAMAEIERNPNWRPGSESFDLGNGSYRLSIEDLGSGRYLLVSEGTVRGVTERVSMDFRYGSFGPFSYGMYIGVGGINIPSGRHLSFGQRVNSVYVNGDLAGDWSNVRSFGSQIVYVYYTGENRTGRSVWDNSRVRLEKVSDVSWDKPGLDYYKSKPHTVLNSGTLAPTSSNPFNLNNGLYIREGNLNIQGSFTGNGVIVVSGNITVTDNLRSTGNLLLISLSNIDLSTQGADQVEASLIAYNTLRWYGNAKVSGAVAAEYLVWHDNLAVEGWLNQDLGDLVGEGFSWGSWSEGN